MEKIKKGEKFRIVTGGGVGMLAIYGSVSVAESSGNLLLVTLDSDPNQYAIYYYDYNSSRVLTHAVLFGETGGDQVRHIPGREVRTASLDVAKAKFTELAELRLRQENEAAEKSQAEAIRKEAAEKEAARRTALIQDAKELLLDSKQQLKDLVKGHSNIQDLMFDDDVVNLTNQIIKLEILIKHI